MFQAGVAIVERDAPVEGLVDLHFGTGEAEAARLLGDLEATAFPLHDVVVADHALVHQAANTVEALRSGTPRGCPFARLPSKTAVVVGGELLPPGTGDAQTQRSGPRPYPAEARPYPAPP